jgi:CRP-like cAMP-binding protein
MIPMDAAIISLIEECPLFKGVARDEIERLLSGSSARIRHFRNNDLVAQAGDQVSFLNIVVGGSIKGEMTDASGKVIRIEDILPPRPLAPAFLFGPQNRYPVQITAHGEATLLSIPRDEFLKMMQAHEGVLTNFINILSSRAQFLSGKLRFLSFSSLRGKISQYLLDLARNRGSDQFVIPLSQTQLSELFGVARPSVGRVLVELNQEGLILSEGKQVTILDRERLQSSMVHGS